MRLTARIAVASLAFALVPALLDAAWRAEGPALASVSRLAVAPSSPDTVYAATAGGGVWRSDDGGRSWALPGDGMTGRRASWIAVDPSDAASVWAGVEGGSSFVWRSTDSGASWEALGGSYPGGRLQPVGQPVAFASARTILLPSTNLHYRSDDGGATWRDFRVPNQDAYVFAVNPKDPKIVYAGGRGESLNIARSTDGGKTWKQTGIGLGKNSVKVLLIDPAEPTTLYAAAGTFAAVFKSTDSGDNWTQLELPVGGTSDLFDLSLDPREGKTLWAATENGLYRSKDGGTTWQGADRGMGRYLAKCVVFDPRDADHLVAGTATGIYESRDGGDSWSLSSRGLSGGWVRKLWGAPGASALFAQLSVGLYRFDGAGAWSEITEPFESGKAAEIDGILYESRSTQNLYAFDTSKYWHSSDGGQRWQEIEQKGPSMKEMMKGNLESAQFASLAQDRGDAKTLYAGSWSNDGAGGAVYKTTDGGKKWAPSGSGVPNGKVGLLRAGAPGTVYALVAETSVYRTTNGGGAWSAGSGLADAKIHDLAVDDTTPTRLYAASEKGLFRSTDAGATWSRVANGLEDDEIEAVVVDPASGALYAGSLHGVFRSTDGGESFAAFEHGADNFLQGDAVTALRDMHAPRAVLERAAALAEADPDSYVQSRGEILRNFIRSRPEEDAATATRATDPAAAKAGVEYLDRRGITVSTEALRDAAGRADADAVKALLDAGVAPDGGVSDLGQTPIYRAVAQGCNSQGEETDWLIETIRLLVAAGADLDRLDDNRNTVLMSAAQYCGARTVDTLVAGGARVDVRNGSGITPLAMALIMSRFDAAEALVAKGARLTEQDAPMVSGVTDPRGKAIIARATKG